MIPTSDMGAILFGGEKARTGIAEALVSGGSVYLDAPEAGGLPVDCAVLSHVGPLSDGDSVLIVMAPNGANYVIGRL